MTAQKLKELLEQVARGELDTQAALERLKGLPYEDLGFARVDHHRTLRQGFPEVVYGQGKTPEQIAAIARALFDQGSAVLVTRVDPEKARAVRERFPELSYHGEASCLAHPGREEPRPGRGGSNGWSKTFGPGFRPGTTSSTWSRWRRWPRRRRPTAS